MLTTVLSEKGQVVIPRAVRSELGLEKGDRFEVRVEGEQLILQPLPRHPLLELYGAFKGDYSLTEDLLAEREADRLREERKILG